MRLLCVRIFLSFSFDVWTTSVSLEAQVNHLIRVTYELVVKNYACSNKNNTMTNNM